MKIEFIEIDINGYRICDAPNATEASETIAPHVAPDLTMPDGMRKARYLSGSWIDEEALLLEADLKARQLQDIENAIDIHIDATAQAKGYNSTESCLSYIGDANIQWNAEAVAFKAWRSQCWEYVIAERVKIDALQRTIPTHEEAVAEIELLFPMVWP